MTSTTAAQLNLPILRAETPGIRHRAHFNNAGASLMPVPVLTAVTDYLVRESEIGGYETAAENYDKLNSVYASIARLVGANPDEISIAENATIAWQRAFYAMKFREGDRKYLRAPRGTGFLYMRKGLLERTEPAMLDLFGATMTSANTYELRPDARRFETWETNYSTRMGLGAAVDYALSVGLSAIEARCQELTNALRRDLAEIKGIRLRDIGRHHAAIVSLTVDGFEAAKVMRRLSGEGINVSVSPPSSTPIDAMARDLPPVVRISPHYYNSEEEVARVVETIGRIATSSAV